MFRHSTCRYAINILHHIANTTEAEVQSLAARDLRNILSCFVSLPFRVDNLIAAIKDEIIRRQKSTEQRELASRKLQQALLHIKPEVVKQISQIQNTEPSKAIKRLIRTFGKEKKRKEEDEEDQEEEPFLSSISLADLIEVILTTVEVRDKEVNFPLHESDRVEYGRIQELINQYDRIDFESGARLSRFDKEAQRIMTKRMMSRLLP
jgi:hypothetical protein